MKSLPVVAVVVIATVTLSLTGVPLAAGSVIPDLRLDDFDFPDPWSSTLVHIIPLLRLRKYSYM